VIAAARRLVGFLGELGPRWGLPAEPCRVHAFLYLCARPVAEAEIQSELGLSADAVRDALAWLGDYRLIERMPAGDWCTAADPWELMVRALDERRRREAGPALDTLRLCRDEAATERDPVAQAQIVKLLALVEDLAALDTQMQRLSPRALRRMVDVGGRAARFLDRTLGGGRHGR